MMTQVKEHLKQFLKRFLWTFLVCVLIKVFSSETFLIPSGSMESTVMTGDYVLVNKLYFGARLPKNIREVPWINLPFLLFSGGQTSQDHFDQNVRFPGYATIKHEDILVFNQPFNTTDYFLKRCIALPGDTLNIADTLLTVNGKTLPNPPGVLYQYKVCFKEGTNFENIAHQYNLYFDNGWYESKQLRKTVNITASQKAQLYQETSVLQINRQPAETTAQAHSFTLLIPRKGMVLILDTLNYKTYASLLQKHEGQNITCRDGHFLLNDTTIITRYTFRKNYYFMMGDNRDFSADSRFWGLMPEECIVGKASILLFSVRRFRWNRFIRLLD